MGGPGSGRHATGRSEKGKSYKFMKIKGSKKLNNKMIKKFGPLPKLPKGR